MSVGEWYLNPVGGDLGDGEHDGTGVRGGNNPCGIFRLLGGSGPRDKLPIEEFIEVSVTIGQIFDQQLLGLNCILFDKVGLHHISTTNTSHHNWARKRRHAGWGEGVKGRGSYDFGD